MATAVLLPQDCLPSSKSRQKSKFSGTAWYAHGAPRAKRGTSRTFMVKDTTPLYPVPSKGPGRTEWTVKTSKQDIGGPDSSRSPSVAVGGEAIGLKCQDSKCITGSKNEGFHTTEPEVFRVHDEDLHVPRLHVSLGSGKEGSAFFSLTGLEVGGDQCCGVSKPMNVMQRNDHDAFWGLLQPESSSKKAGLRAVSEWRSVYSEYIRRPPIFKAGGGTQPTRDENVVQVDVMRLRRASTDPQIVNHVVWPQRSVAVKIPKYSDCGKSLNGFTGSGMLMSSPERWAGPAYSSSPPPSSLPLPKFSLGSSRDVTQLQPVMSTPGLEAPTRGGPCSSSNVSQLRAFMSTSALEVPTQGGMASDVALATRSLRRMLKLDPY